MIDDLITALTPSLFWDVERSSIDTKKHAFYDIHRVMSRGSLPDFQQIKAFYGKPKIKRVVKNLRYMDDRLLHFCSAYFNTPITEFRCYTQKQLNQTHWNY